MDSYDVLVVGAGPAGLAADDNPAPECEPALKRLMSGIEVRTDG